MVQKWPNDPSSHRRSGGTGKAEAAKLPGAGIGQKQCPGKCAVEKGQLGEMSEGRDEEQT